MICYRVSVGRVNMVVRAMLNAPREEEYKVVLDFSFYCVIER